MACCASSMRNQMIVWISRSAVHRAASLAPATHAGVGSCMCTCTYMHRAGITTQPQESQSLNPP